MDPKRFRDGLLYAPTRLIFLPTGSRMSRPSTGEGPLDLKGKVALLTGGARMGPAIAARLAQAGCDVAAAYRTSRTSADEAIRGVRAVGRRGKTLRADLLQESQVERLIGQVQDTFGRLDILINMASVYEKTPFSRLDKRAWSSNIDANLKSVYLLTTKASDALRRHGSGRIINFSDWLARSGRPRYHDYLPYYVSKMGVIGLTEALALELAPSILVNAIAPGPIIPPKNLSPKEDAEVRKETPLGRWGSANEIAKAVLFLAETDFVTGECIRVDGGRHLR